MSAESDPILSISGLRVEFGRRRGGAKTVALDDVSLEIQRGQTVGLVGESGSGKTTLGKTVLRLYDPAAGSIKFQGNEIGAIPRRKMRPLRRDIQMVFQDPFGSLNPRLTVGKLVGEPLVVHRLSDSGEARSTVSEMLDLVGLPRSAYDRFPAEFSGGQRQRINLARALVTRPALVIADEPTSALDVSIQAQIVNLLKDVQAELGLTYLFISHDLGVVRLMADRVVVLNGGVVVESGPTDEVFGSPASEYTRSLIDAVPRIDPARERARRGHRVTANVAREDKGDVE